jgi:hypothetical protein
MSIPVVIDPKPCAAEALVGTGREIMHGRGRRRRLYKGIVTEWRYGTGVVEQFEAPEDGSRPLAYPTFELKLKLDDNTTSRWIGPFKDGNNGYPSETWLGWEETLNRRDPYYLLCSIRMTLFGYCASEPVDVTQRSAAWDAAAMQALEEVCDLVDEHFPDAD